MPAKDDRHWRVVLRNASKDMLRSGDRIYAGIGERLANMLDEGASRELVQNMMDSILQEVRSLRDDVRKIIALR